jgi:hypothetical protein
MMLKLFSSESSNAIMLHTGGTVARDINPHFECELVIF